MSRLELPCAPLARCALARLGLVVVGVGAPACGTSVEPIEVAGGCPEQPLRAPGLLGGAAPERLIDDFEGPEGELPRSGQRDGSWIVGSDLTSQLLVAETASRCAALGRRAGHFSGREFTSWGANWTAVFRRPDSAGMAVGYDASQYSGISFWAATGEGGLELPVGVTTLDVAWNGGVCSECMDYHRTSVSLSPTWRRFELRFSELVQSGTGDPLVPLRPERLVGFIIWPSGTFDIWLDEIRFE